MFKSLKKKFIFLNMIIISIVMLISFSVIYGLTYFNTYNDSVDAVRKMELRILNNIRNPYEEHSGAYEDITSFRLFLKDDYSLNQISSRLDISDEIYFDIVDQIVLNDSPTDFIEINGKKYLYDISRMPKDIFGHEILSDTYYRVEFLDVTNVFNTLNLLLLVLILVWLIMLIVIYFISLYFANKSVKPLELIWNKQKQFIADATHELKTPITIINANVDAIKLNKDDLVSEQTRWLEYIKKETNGMNKLINELLSSAKADEENYNFNICNISELINNISLIFETVIFEKNIKLKTKIDKDIMYLTDYSKLEQVIKILLDNAIKYNKDNGYISITLYKVKKNIYINIENSGIGISENEIELIFDRFYKSDKSRSDNSYGLGLYIARSIINKLNGTLTVKSELNKKTIFTIKL